MARARHQVGAFTKRVLELSTCDQPEHVRTVVHDRGTDFLCCCGHFLEGRGEQEHRLSEQGHFRFHVPDCFACGVDIGLHPLFVPRISGKVEVPQTNGAHPRMGDVAAVSGGNGSDVVARFGQNLQGTDV